MLLVSLGPDRAAEVFKHLRDEEIETLSLEMAKLQRVDPVTTGAVLEEFAATIEAYDSLMAGGVDYAREVLERALGPRARARDHRAALERDRDAAVRVPAQDAARAARDLPAQRVAPDGGARRGQPAHHAGLAGALAPARRRAGRDRAAHRADGRDQPGRGQAGRGGDEAEARQRRAAGVLRPPAGSSRWPRSSTTPTARPSATCSTR